MVNAPRDDAERPGSDRALLVVDVQNDFADPDGSLYVTRAEAVIPTINDMVRTARAAGELVVYTQDWHPPATPHFAKDGGIWPVHCVAGTWGAEFHQDLLVDGPTIRKGIDGEDGYSGFSTRDAVTGELAQTELAELLAERSIRRVAVVGIATDYCVKETALDAVDHELETTVLANAIAAVNLSPGDGEAAIAELRQAGVKVA